MKEKQSKQGDWAVGSFLGCPEAASRFAGVDQAFKQFVKFAKGENKTRLKEAEVRDWLREDVMLTGLGKFTSAWRKTCRMGRSVGKFGKMQTRAKMRNAVKNAVKNAVNKTVDKQFGKEEHPRASLRKAVKNAVDTAVKMVMNSSTVSEEAIKEAEKVGKTKIVAYETQNNVAKLANETVQPAGKPGISKAYMKCLSNEIDGTQKLSRLASKTMNKGMFHSYANTVDRFVLATQAAGGIGRLEKEKHFNVDGDGFLVEDSVDFVDINADFGGHFGGIMMEQVLSIWDLTEDAYNEIVPFTGELPFIDTIREYVYVNKVNKGGKLDKAQPPNVPVPEVPTEEQAASMLEAAETDGKPLDIGKALPLTLSVKHAIPRPDKSQVEEDISEIVDQLPGIGVEQKGGTGLNEPISGNFA